MGSEPALPGKNLLNAASDVWLKSLDLTSAKKSYHARDSNNRLAKQEFHDKFAQLMFMPKRSAFARRLPDLVNEELVAALSEKLI